MATLGNSFEESVALMVGAGEQMPNQSGKIARGLKIASWASIKQHKLRERLVIFFLLNYNSNTIMAMRNGKGIVKTEKTSRKSATNYP